MPIERLYVSYPQFDQPGASAELRGLAHSMRVFQTHMVDKANEMVAEVNRLTEALTAAEARIESLESNP